MGLTHASRNLQHVCYQPSADGGTGLVFLVLACVGEVGDHSRDTTSRGSAAGVDHDEQFHQAIIDIARRCRLKNEDIFISNRLANRHTSLLVGVVEAHSIGDADAQSAAKKSVWSLLNSDSSVPCLLFFFFSFSFHRRLTRHTG